MITHALSASHSCDAMHHKAREDHPDTVMVVSSRVEASEDDSMIASTDAGLRGTLDTGLTSPLQGSTSPTRDGSGHEGGKLAANPGCGCCITNDTALIAAAIARYQWHRALKFVKVDPQNDTFAT